MGTRSHRSVVDVPAAEAYADKCRVAHRGYDAVIPCEVNERPAVRRRRVPAVAAAIGSLAAVALVGVNTAAATLRTVSQQDMAAEEVAQVAQVAIETVATDHGGSYAAANGKPSVLHAYVSSLAIRPPGKGLPYLSAVRATSQTYTLTITSASGHTFSVARTVSGNFARTCTPRHGLHGKCLNGHWP